jgi:hypothetical protein
MHTLAFVLTAMAIASVAGAQPPAIPDPVPAALAGRWEGSGTILGQASRVELEWVPVLDGHFTRLTFVSHIGPAPATRRFEGHAYYRAAPGGRLQATWFDSSGMIRPITATVTEDAVIAKWGTADTEEGETTYRLTGTDNLEVVDRVRGKGGLWREFGRTTLARVR